MSDWQPIDSAPKKPSEKIQIWNGKIVDSAIWSERYGWISWADAGGTLYIIGATHWKPLSEPPRA